MATLYALVALGSTGGDIQFYHFAGWVRLWRDPYKMIDSIKECGVPGYWRLYVIGYKMTESELGDMPIFCDRHEFERRYGYDYYGGRDLISLGRVRDLV